MYIYILCCIFVLIDFEKFVYNFNAVIFKYKNKILNTIEIFFILTMNWNFLIKKVIELIAKSNFMIFEIFNYINLLTKKMNYTKEIIENYIIILKIRNITILKNQNIIILKD